MNDFKIAASIMAANPLELGKEISSVYEAGVDWIHFDVMDNHYVPNLTYGPMVCEKIREKFPELPIDVHLMTSPVDNIIPAFATSGATIITIHPETTHHVHRSLMSIKNFGCQAGIALNPGTPLQCLDYLIEEIDLILIMSVNPGFGGQNFIPSTLKKITDVCHYLKRFPEKNIRLEVDGGVSVNNIINIANAGANTFVAGSAIFAASNHAAIITTMKNIIQKLTTTSPHYQLTK